MNQEPIPECPQCGATLPPDAPDGLCPRCVMEMNLRTQTFMSGQAGGPQQPPLPPEELAPHFPQLEILECLGRGGMGVVYKARQKSLNRLVALKLLAPERSEDPQFAARFEKEARALATLDHPNIVTIHDHGQAGGFYYLLMEFVDGVTLRQLLQGDRISTREALAIVPQICDALQFAHDHGIVHRDIKSENILLDRRGRVKVADFGLAKMVEAAGDGLKDVGEERRPQADATDNLSLDGKVMGTPQYMSPEQIQAPGEVDHRADIYAMGVVFYQMLTGELPGEKIEAPSKKVRLDVRLDEVVLRALESKPELRYQQASIFKTQVETIAEGTENAAFPVESPAAGRVVKPRGRWRRVAMIPAALTLVLFAACVFWLQRPRPVGGMTAAPSPDGRYEAMASTWHAMRILGKDALFYRFNVQGRGGAVSKTWEIPVPTGKVATTYLARPVDDYGFEDRGRIAWNGDGGHVIFLVDGVEVSGFDTGTAKPMGEVEIRSKSISTTFGPVVERVIPLTALDAPSYIDFQTGNIASKNWKTGEARDHQVRAWMRQMGADALAHEWEGVPRLVGNHGGCVFVPESGKSFESLQAGDIDAKLKVVAERNLAWDYATMADPFWFRTGDGAKGVMQILGITDNPRGVKIRYKLLQASDVSGIRTSVPLPER